MIKVRISLKILVRFDRTGRHSARARRTPHPRQTRSPSTRIYLKCLSLYNDVGTPYAYSGGGCRTLARHKIFRYTIFFSCIPSSQRPPLSDLKEELLGLYINLYL